MPSASNSSASRSRHTPRSSSSRVRFSEDLQVLPVYNESQLDDYPASPRSSLPQSRFSTTPGAISQWQFPRGSVSGALPTQDMHLSLGLPSRDSGERRRGSDTSDRTLHDTDQRRESDASDSTLRDEDNNAEDFSRFSFSSYKHPYDIQPPPGAHGHSPQDTQYFTRAQAPGKSPKLLDEQDREGQYRRESEDVEKAVNETCAQLPRRRRGYLSNLIDLYNAYDDESEDPEHDDGATERRSAIIDATRRTSRLVDPLAYNDEQILDPDDPVITGARKKCLEDAEDVEKNARRLMNYKDRRKQQERIRIEFNVSSVLNRQHYLMRLAKALLTFGAPSHRIESQLLSAARILEVDAEFTHMPGLIIASFGDEETKTSQMHFVKCGGRLSLGNLHRLHQVYRTVVHDEVSARKATDQIQALLDKGPLYGLPFRIIFAFFIAALICPLAFGGSLADMGFAGLGSLFLFCMQTGVASRRSIIYANVFEILSVIAISFCARGLSSIRSQIFCYASISSAAIVTILPGYLVLTSSLDLASKNILSGSIKMVYALIYALFLGFGLQFGSDLFLIFDQSARKDLDTLAAHAAATVTVTGSYLADNSTNLPEGLAKLGSFSFTPSTPLIRQNINKGCYRPSTFAWYLQPFPWWTQFIIVPVFSILSSLNNEQPINWDLLVMVIISCVSYTANKVADHFIFNRSDVVSAIGAFAVGMLGNLYSRKMGGTAFTSMVTGVLFLVPSGLSEAGGITAQNSATQIGSAMISVSVGITVGLFMSQALVYMFGSRKSAAIFSF
ncbi:hypothetical protein NM688_g6950 [Phlebia brevispora]|uniref:Uncharacterized protein n=1 Tax=Phlebia brevispora TaxID=194682 RepID=A0ACC1SAU7_9APHY|nr:hypothetical protein NM688_g6950 [Phlebia brevispora]